MNLAKDALHVLGSVAPTIATALGGPFAGMAVNALEGLIQGKVPTDAPAADKQKAIENALLGGDPQTLVQLRQLENDFTVKMEQLGIDKEKLVYDDLANARAMSVATKDPTAGRLAWLVIGGFLAFSLAEAVAMIGWPDHVAKVPAAAWSLLGTVLGYLANEAKQAAAFYFGSSASSQNKDSTLAELAKGAQTQ